MDVNFPEKYLKKTNLYFIGIADNDIKLCNQHLFSADIFYANDIPKINFDLLYLVGPQQKEIYKQMKTLKVNKEKIHLVSKKESTPSNNSLNARNKLFNILLENIANAFKESSVDLWAMNSFLLSIYRNQPFSYFTDIDIFHKSNDYEKIKNILLNHNINFYEVMFDNFTKKMVATYGDKNSIICEPATIDFKPFNVYKDVLISISENRRYPLHFFKNNKEIEISNLVVSIPNNAELILVALYGNNWKVENEEWIESYFEKKSAGVMQLL